MENNDTSLCYLPDEAATLSMAASLAPALSAGLVIYLQGNLGAGKTTFTRGLLQGLSYKGKVKSPTYTLVESYPCPDFTLHHFDLYRFADPEEWEDAGFREYFGPDTLCMVEWADKAGELLPPADITIQLDVCQNGRQLIVNAFTEAGTSCLKRHSTQAGVGS